MDTVVIVIVVVVAVLALLAVGVVLARATRRRALENRLGRADELRHEAAGRSDDVQRLNQRAAEADTEATAARERADRAERWAATARQEATQAQARQEDVIREADRVDPRVDHRAAGYRPTTDPQALKDPGPSAGGASEEEAEPPRSG